MCLCVVSETRRLKVEDCPLSICLSWLQCGGLDRHQFILVENDASEVDVSCATAACTHTHTHLFNGPFFGTTQMSRYQKGKTDLDFRQETVSGPYASLHLAPDG